jgi:hypothetical protein
MLFGVGGINFFTLLIPLAQSGSPLIVIGLLTGFAISFAASALFPIAAELMPLGVSSTRPTVATTALRFFAVDRRDGTLTSVGWSLTHPKSPRFFASIPPPNSSMRQTPTRTLAIGGTLTRSCRWGSTKRTER